MNEWMNERTDERINEWILQTIIEHDRAFLFLDIYICVAIALNETNILVAVHFWMKNIYQ